MLHKLHDGRWINTAHVMEIRDEGHGDIRIIMSYKRDDGDDIVIKEDLDSLCYIINQTERS